MIRIGLSALGYKFQSLAADEILVVAHNHHFYYITGVDIEKEEIHLVSASSLLIGQSPETATFDDCHLIIVDQGYNRLDPTDDLYSETIQQGLRNTYKKMYTEFVFWDEGEQPTQHYYGIALKKKD